MTIRRKRNAASRTLHPALQPCLDAEQAIQRGREAVNRVFEKAAEEVNGEIARARAVFTQAENQLSTDGQKVRGVMAACKSAAEAAYGKTSETAAESEASARSTVNAMLEKLNRISESLATVQKPVGKEQR